MFAGFLASSEIHLHSTFGRLFTLEVAFSMMM